MDWKHRISWTGSKAPVPLFETDNTVWFLWINKAQDGHYGGRFERHMKPVPPIISQSKGYSFGKSYKTRKRLLYYAREYAKRVTESGN